MTKILAVAGKGGTGKTTVCGLLIDYLVEKAVGPILAVDADANSNLNEVLGVEIETTIGEIREELMNADEMKEKPIPNGMSRDVYAEMKVNSALIEADHFDLLVMGRSQGDGCYCFVNNVLKARIEMIYRNYNYMVVDNEAGMEHISRRILPPVDMVLLVSDSSKRGVQAAGRIARLVRELNNDVKDVKLIINRSPSPEVSEELKKEIEANGLVLAGVLPQDEDVYEYDNVGTPTVKLPKDSKIKLAFNKIADSLHIV